MTATPPTTDDDSPPPVTERADATAEPAQTAHPTGEAQAAENVDNESPG